MKFVLITEITSKHGDTTKPDGPRQELLARSQLASTGWAPRIKLHGGTTKVTSKYRKSGAEEAQ